MKNGKKYLTLRYSFVQCFLWMGYTVLPGFQSVFLLNAGFSNAQIGMISASAFIISAILQPIVAAYADRKSSPSVKIILAFTAILIIAFSVLLFILRDTMWPLGIVFGLSISILILMTPLVNSLGTESINQGENLNFGVARGIGSLGYGALAYVSGQVVERIGVNTIPVFAFVVNVLFFMSLILFPFRKTDITKKQDSKKSRTQNFFLKKYPSFTLMLIGCVFLYSSHSIINNFAFQIVSNLGGASAQLGTAMTISALIELPTMFLFAYYLKVAKLPTLFCASSIFMALKAMGTLFAGNIVFLYGVQVLQIFGWALISVASVYYVNSIIDHEDSVQGQSYMITSYTIGCIIGSLAGGRILDSAGVKGMLIAASLFAVLGMAIIIRTVASNKTSIRH